METSNLPDAELKTLVIRLLKELRGRIDELSENFNKEIKTKMEMKNTTGSQSEMKNTISKMKNILERTNRVNETEDQTSNIGDMLAEDTQSEQQQEKGIQNK